MTDSLLFSQCRPHDRDWEHSQQRCEFCEIRGLPCGPNLRCSDDPATIRRRTENTNTLASDQANDGDLEGSIVWSAPDVTLPPGRRTEERNSGPLNVDRVKDGKELLGTPSIKALEEKASSK